MRRLRKLSNLPKFKQVVEPGSDSSSDFKNKTKPGRCSFKARAHTLVWEVLIYVCLCCYTWRRQWHPTPVLLPGKSQGRRSLVGCSPGVARSRTRLERLHFHALENEMATHSSVLAWRIPGTGEPGGLPSLGSHRVGHD